MHVDKLVGDEQNRCEVGQTSAETEDNGCSGSGGGGGGSSGCDCGSEENALASEGSDMASADERALTSGYCGEETHVAGMLDSSGLSASELLSGPSALVRCTGLSALVYAAPA